MQSASPNGPADGQSPGKSVLVSEVLAVASAVCMALSLMFLSELRGRVPLGAAIAIAGSALIGGG